MERKKFCPVCGELAAVLDGNPEKYGKKAVPWHTFIRVKYDCDECRDIMNRQSKRLSDKRCRRRRRECREAAFEAIDVLREEVRLSRKRIAELEARL